MRPHVKPSCRPISTRRKLCRIKKQGHNHRQKSGTTQTSGDRISQQITTLTLIKSFKIDTRPFTAQLRR